MSLINDALKRAAADKPRDVSSPGGAPMQPVESAPKTSASPLLLGGILLLGLGMIGIAAALWFGAKTTGNQIAHSSTTPPAISSSPTPNAQPASPPAIMATSNNSSTVAAKTAATVIPEPQRPQNSVQPSATPKIESPAATTKAPAQTLPAAKAPNPAAAAAAEKPVRLQSIFYRLKSPTVIINGKTLRVGDSVDGIKVVSIQRTSVEIVQNGKYRTLTLQD